MIQTKLREYLSFLSNPEKLSSQSAEFFRSAAQIVLSSRYHDSKTTLRPDRPNRDEGRTFPAVLGYDSEATTHLTIFKNSLDQSTSPISPQPEWLGGYGFLPFPQQEAFSQAQRVTVCGVREEFGVKELYYGSHPDATKIDPQTGFITPDMLSQFSAQGVLSSPLDVARQSKLRIWFAPYKVSGLEWQQRLASDPFAQVHLLFQGMINFDGFERNRFFLDIPALRHEVIDENLDACYEELTIVERAQPTFSIVELGRISDGVRSWRVYASGNTHEFVPHEKKQASTVLGFLKNPLAIATR